LSAGFLGQPDPRIAQQGAELKHKLELIRLQQSVERQRMDKTKLQLTIAKDLWDTAPEMALKQYENSGLVKFSPEERQTVLEGKQAAQIPHRMEAVLGALDANIDPRTLPPALTHGFNVPALQALPKSVRDELAPNRRKQIADALAAETKGAFEQARLARDKRIEAGVATPADLQLAGAKTPEDIGQRLMTQSITSGLKKQRLSSEARATKPRRPRPSGRLPSPISTERTTTRWQTRSAPGSLNKGCCRMTPRRQ